jgi:DNA ligase-1
MNKNYSPMLAPNESINTADLKYPLLASYKLDGIRAIFKDGTVVTRALKPFPNVQIHRKFKALMDFTNNKDDKFRATIRAAGTQSYCQASPILDGEFLSHSTPFTEISGIIRALDRPLPEDFFFYIFDTITDGDYYESFISRVEKAERIAKEFPDLVRHVKHILVRNPQDVQKYYEEALAWGCDGLILRSAEGHYKCGRGTLKEGLIFKLKPYLTFDAKIIDVIQATKVDPKAEKKINELGRSVTSKKLGDRILIEKACDFVVLHEGEKELKVMIAMTDEEKKEVWVNRKNYIGRYIEYKGLMVGAKDLPRHPVFLRYRDDKNI